MLRCKVAATATATAAATPAAAATAATGSFQSNYIRFTETFLSHPR